MPRVRRTSSSLVTVVALIFALLSGVGGLVANASHGPQNASADRSAAPEATAEGSEDPRTGPTTVAPSLETALEESSAVEAVVTTWTRDGLARVRALGVEGAELRRLPMVLVPALTSDQLAALRAEPAIRSVYPNESYELFMEDTTWIVGARDAWGEYEEDGDGWRLNETGYTGDGIEIAVIDTGADTRHPDYEHLVEFCEAFQVGSVTNTLFCSDGAGAQDDQGHGTHVAGTIGGTGAASGGKDDPRSTIGIAPDVSVRAYSANVGISLLAFQTLGAYDDLIDKKLSGENDVVAVNNSWGGGTNYDPNAPQSVASQLAYEAGILSVFSAGNSGPEHNTLSSQCLSPYVVCVGASTKSDAVGMLSSRGRPSQPQDTDRDGDIDDDDVAPDNHDRALGQELGLALHRPSVVAPGLEINSMSANQPTCYAAGEGCYEPLQGTSMAAPHVTGAAAVIADAYLDTHGVLPSPSEITEILEASARNLPGYRPEEQGAGRIDVARAAEFARAWPDIPAIRLGDPLVAVTGDEPSGATLGCTAPLSHNTGAGVAVHTFDVAEDTERLEIDVQWGQFHPSANLYLQLWRPGADPETAIPDNSSMWLLGSLPVPTIDSRWIDVRMPEPGEWTLHVSHRAGGAPLPCADQGIGYMYDLTVRTPLVAEDAPEVTSAVLNERDDRFVDVDGTAAFTSPDEGVTWSEVPGTEPEASGGEEEGGRISAPSST